MWIRGMVSGVLFLLYLWASRDVEEIKVAFVL